MRETTGAAIRTAPSRNCGMQINQKPARECNSPQRFPNGNFALLHAFVSLA